MIMRKHLFLIIALCLHIAARGQTNTDADITNISLPIEAESLRYWFDSGTENMQTVSSLSGAYTLDVSTLGDGLHTLYYQVIGTDGAGYGLAADVFLKIENFEELTVGANIAAVGLQYWFDSDTENMQTVNGLAGAYTLDVSTLEDGMHTLYYQVIGVDGAGYGIASEVFLKMSNSITEPAIAEAPVAKNLRYWFNDDFSSAVLTNLTNGIQTLDVSSLPSGLHTLYYQIVYDDGNAGPAVAGIFLKNIEMPEENGPNGITQYQYWLNDDRIYKTVPLENATNPYRLLELLPVPKEPIRSSCFHFEAKDGKPMMYAKNDFHIRFHDATEYFVDDSRQFIDYSVSQEVKPVQPLEGYMDNVSFNRPASNEVVWYTMHAEPGDTVTFRSSQATTIQLFAPSGSEVFNTSEYESVKWSGIHTWEDGTYYLAVHDVTGSKEDMMLEYMHMDKYDVVDWDVHTVGNGGCSTITFKGNGFRDLYAVDLVIAPGDTIRSVDVTHDSDAETAVTFDFTDATLGEYNAVFHFTEEDKSFANIVTVEEAVDIELATDVSFPSSFLRGSTVTYTYTITNTGNMTAYCVPIYIYCETPTIGGITHLKLDGLNLSSIIEGVNTENLNPTERNKLEEWANQIGDDHYFLRIKKAGNNTNDSVIVRSNYFTITLPPYGTRVIRLQLTSNQSPNVWFTSLKSIPPFSIMTNNYSIEYNGFSKKYNTKKNVESIRDWYCCIRERTECMLDRVAFCLERASLFGTDGAIGLAASGLFLGPEMLVPSAIVLEAAQVFGTSSSLLNLFSTNSKVYGNAICGDSNTNIWDAFRKSVFEENRRSVTNTLGNAILDEIDNMTGNPVGLAFNEAKHIQETMIAAQHGITYGMNTYLWGNEDGNQPLGLAQCMAFKELSPDCIPDEPEGGSSNPQPPSDPNDIYGPLSVAGSKFIVDSLARVNYTIEFENDTTFATAAAHTIVIKDTLDSKYFDLKAFTPTGVRIGSREVFLNEADVVINNDKTTFVKTIDMRPEINAIAQVEGSYHQTKGIAQWTFTSLDPMTMESTNDLMQGILPVNYDGTSGIGEVMFEIGVKSGKNDGAEIKNRAGIVFDYEEAILTPTWTNIVDAVAPSSIVDGLTMLNDSTLRVFADASDARSGVWKYEWYVQHGENAPWWKEGETYDDSFDFHFYEGFDYGFCVVVTDSAGNVEKKELAREHIFKSYGQDFEDKIDEVNDQWSIVNGQSIYDLSGRRHNEPQEGVNIIDKKKILFRRKGK